MENGGEFVIQGLGLAKRYKSGGGEITVFSNVNFSVPQGQRLALVGESGAGKSSLLYLLGGLDSPSAGTIYFGNTDIVGLSAADLAVFRNREIGFVWQNHGLLPEFTAQENVMMPLLIRGIDATEAGSRALARLDEVGLQNRASHRAGELSGGEQQRVALARALAGNPRVLLADEPTGNLDYGTSEMIFHLLEDLHRSHSLTSIFVTHNLSFAARCDRILQLDKGSLVPWTGDGFPLQTPVNSESSQRGTEMWKDGGNHV